MAFFTFSDFNICVKFSSLALVTRSLIFETLSQLGSIRKLNRFSADHRVTQYIIKKYSFYLASTAPDRCWIIKQYNIVKVYYSPTNAQVIVLKKTIIKFTLK